jgi:hypothetical protein
LIIVTNDYFTFEGNKFKVVRSLENDRIKEAYSKIVNQEDPCLTQEEKALNILNIYRNFYYKEGDCEKGIIAQAINELLPRYGRLKENIINNDLK